MENPRPEKVAVVDEVRERFEASSGALLTEYRGLDVAQMAELRRSLRQAGCEYRIYKNTLVRRATDDLDVDLSGLLTGPTAIAFVVGTGDGPADPAAVAKALRDFARTNENLVVKGGVLGSTVLSAAEAQALAELPSREVLLAMFAGALQAPLTKVARLLNAVPSKFAYALQALIDDGGAAGAPAAPPEAAPATEASTSEPEPEAEAPEAEPTDEVPAADAGEADQTETQES